MDSLVAIFCVILLDSHFVLISAIGPKFMGSFYCVQEGFFPRSFENEFVKYETVLRGSKSDFEDRRIYGNFTFKKPLENIGIISEFYKEGSNGEWKQYGNSFKTENLCKSSNRAEHFNKRFNAPLDEEKCGIPAGKYYLDGYNVEDDVKDATDTMIYGHWKMVMEMQADVEGKRVSVCPMTYQLWFKDDFNKKQAASAGKARGNKKQKNYFE